MEDKYVTLIDSKEFQEKILEFITSEELDKVFNHTVFVDIPECKQAMIHGMCIASMLICKCEQIIGKQNAI